MWASEWRWLDMMPLMAFLLGWRTRGAFTYVAFRLQSPNKTIRKQSPGKKGIFRSPQLSTFLTI